MPTLKFSKDSLKRLDSCHPLLQRLFRDALEVSPYDFTVLCGYRSKEEQDLAFARGNSRLKWPQSRHNKSPSLAVDVVPYPVDWNDIDRFKSLAATIKSVWDTIPDEEKMGWQLSHGGDWDRFKDWPHWELRS